MINGRINLCKSHERLSAWFSTPPEAWWLKKSIREGVREVCRRGWRSWVSSAWRRPNCTWGELKTSTVCRGLERRQPRSSLNCEGQQTTAAGWSKEIFYQLEEKKALRSWRHQALEQVALRARRVSIRGDCWASTGQALSSTVQLWSQPGGSGRRDAMPSGGHCQPQVLCHSRPVLAAGGAHKERKRINSVIAEPASLYLLQHMNSIQRPCKTFSCKN